MGSAPDAGTAGAGGGGGAGGSAPGDECAYGASLFDDTKMHTIELTFSPGDWASLIENGTNACEYCDDPRPYFPAAMVVDGAAMAGDVGVRLKGHSSLALADSAQHIFPFKVDFNRFTANQSFEGLKKLNLHQNRNGISNVIEYASYKAVRDHFVDGLTPVPAPRTAFVLVTVNGEALGLYNAVEQVSGSYLACHFPEPRGHLYKPEEETEHLSLPFSSYEAYTDLNFKWGPEELQSPTPPVDHSAVGNLITQINQGLSGVESVVHPDGVLLYHAVNVGLGNHDYYGSYGHNYYLYESKPSVFTMLIWDLNEALGFFEGPCGAENLGKPLNQHLLRDPTSIARYQALLTDFLAHQAIAASVDHALTLVSEYVNVEEVLAVKAEAQDSMSEMQQSASAGMSTCDE